VLRRRDTDETIGTVQATVVGATAEAELEAQLAWVIAVPHQGAGYAREAALAVRDRLRNAGVCRFSAFIHPDHAASAGVARTLGLAPTGTVVNGEIRWTDG